MGRNIGSFDKPQYRDPEFQKWKAKEMRERTQYLEVQNAHKRGELIDRREVMEKIGPIFVTLQRIVMRSTALSEGEKKRLLDSIANWPIKLVSSPTEKNGEPEPAPELTVPKRRGPGRPRKTR